MCLKKMEISEVEKEKSHIIVEIIQYIPNAVLSKTILKKITGNITVSSFDAGEELAEKTSPFDNYIQIIDGTASVTINDHIFKLLSQLPVIILVKGTTCLSIKSIYFIFLKISSNKIYFKPSNFH